MCWLPADPPPLPADSACSARSRTACSCAAQLFASRLRSIGDRLERSWTAGGNIGGFGGTPVKAVGRGHLSRFLREALHLTTQVLAVARRHLQGGRAGDRSGSSRAVMEKVAADRRMS